MPDAKPDTVVLVHGLWMTPRSWENWIEYYTAKGLNVLAPGYPGFDIEVEALRENPQVIADLTVPETVDHLAGVVESVQPADSSAAAASVPPPPNATAMPIAAATSTARPAAARPTSSFRFVPPPPGTGRRDFPCGRGFGGMADER